MKDGDRARIGGDRTSVGRSDRRPVGVADFGVTEDGATLVTTGLGSCVAVGLTDGATAAGLLHVMLPVADGRAVENPAKFADTGVTALIEALAAEHVDPKELRAKIAGGSEMVTFDSQERSIGDRNVEAVRRALKEAGVPIDGEDVGGSEGRTVEFTVAGDLVVRTAGAGKRRL